MGGSVSTAPISSELRISWSRLQEWEYCSEKGWLHRQGYRTPTAEIWPAMFAGTVVDRCMREWLSADHPEPGTMAGMVERVMKTEEQTALETGDGQLRWTGKSKAKVREDCMECAAALEPLLLEHVVPYEYEVARRFEAPFTIPHPDGHQQQIKLTGELDLLVREGCQRDNGIIVAPGKLRIWDLKMTRDGSYWRKTYPQLVFYEVCVRLLAGQWPEQSGLIQPLCEQQELHWTFSPEQRAEIMQRVCRMAEAIWSEQHSPKASNAGCDSCYVKHACVKFKPVGRRVPLAR